MIILGTEGLAYEILSILHNSNSTMDICFYDENYSESEFILDKFKVFSDINKLKEFFADSSNKNFVVGVEDPYKREFYYNQMKSLGAKPSILISPKTVVGDFVSSIEEGCILCNGVFISNSVILKKGSVINVMSIVGHDTVIGEFSSIGPQCNLGGSCEIGKFVTIGASSVIYPKVKIADGTVIEPGSIVRKSNIRD